jgi:hypothetical protein
MYGDNLSEKNQRGDKMILKTLPRCTEKHKPCWKCGWCPCVYPEHKCNGLNTEWDEQALQDDQELRKK